MGDLPQYQPIDVAEAKGAEAAAVYSPDAAATLAANSEVGDEIAESEERDAWTLD